MSLFRIFNLGTNEYTKDYLPKIIEDWVTPIENPTEFKGFQRMGKTSLFIANMDLCFVIFAALILIYIVLALIAYKN